MPPPRRPATPTLATTVPRAGARLQTLSATRLKPKTVGTTLNVIPNTIKNADELEFCKNVDYSSNKLNKRKSDCISACYKDTETFFFLITRLAKTYNDLEKYFQ